MEQDKRAAATLRLLKIMDELREKCPWDRKQTFETLRGNTIEETYELADAITAHNMEGIKEELGDLLFAAVKAGRFLHVDSEQALTQACEKFIRRFRAVERLAQGESLDQMELAQLEELWARAKQQEG